MWKKDKDSTPEEDDLSKFFDMFSSIIDSVSKNEGSNDNKSTETVIIEKSIAIALGTAVGVGVSVIHNRRSLKKRVDSLETRVSRLEKEELK